MARRPRSHSTGDVAVNYVSSIFLDAEWTCDPVRSDYGEDLAVRIFEEEQATAKFLYVQSKGHHGPIVWDQHGCHRVSLGRTAVALWRSFRIPVIITLYDRSSKKAYWQCVQDYLDSLPFDLADATSSILISRDGELTSRSIQQLSDIATDHYESGDRAQISWIQQQLESKYGLDVILEERVSFWPSGKFVPDGGDTQGIVSGSTLRKLEKLAKLLGRDPEELLPEVLRGAIQLNFPNNKSGKFVSNGEVFTSGRRYWEVQAARSIHLEPSAPDPKTERS